jgi:hypothetical protein
MDRYNLKILKDVEVIEEYQVKVSNTFTTSENLDDDDDDDVDINNAWEFFKESVKISDTEILRYS